MQPYLAESIVPNGTTRSWTMTCGPTSSSTTARRATARPLLANFEAHYRPLLSGLVLQPIVETTSSTGPLASRINLKQPWVPFPFYLAGGIGGQLGYIIAPAMIAAGTNGTDQPVGTGPFKFDEWVPNDHFTATANPHYWRRACPTWTASPTGPSPTPTPGPGARGGTIDIMHTDTPRSSSSTAATPVGYIDDCSPWSASRT